MGRRTRRRMSGWSRGVFLAGLLAVAFAAPADTASPPSRLPRPTLDAAQGEKCVADTDVMRRNHMKLLAHQREETVHAGVRPRNTALEGCIACHASTKTGSVVGSDQNFCQGCHAYAAVKLDCFECHASKPESTSAASRTNVVGPAQ